MTAGGWGSWSPTQDAIKLRLEWGTQILADWCIAKCRSLDSLRFAPVAQDDKSIKENSLRMTAGGWGSWSPTQDATKLRLEWGTQILADWCIAKCRFLDSLRCASVAQDDESIKEKSLRMTAGGWGSWSPTQDATKRRLGWGTEILADWCIAKCRSLDSLRFAPVA